MVTYSNDGLSPVVRFRLPYWLIEILKVEGDKRYLSEDLAAKTFLLDHLINLKLIPLKLIPNLIKETRQDFFQEIKKSYNLTDSELNKLIVNAS